MNKESQKRKIARFLNGKINKDIDPFCIYQWIERCFYHGWWKLGIQLASSLPPNSIGDHFQKRLDYLLLECRRNAKEDTKHKSITKHNILHEILFDFELQISPKEASELLGNIPNKTFERALERNWHCNDEGYISAQSVLWLFCWAKTGMGSQWAAMEAQSVFDRIFPFTYNFFDSRIDHEWARKMRYSKENIGHVLKNLLRE